MHMGFLGKNINLALVGLILALVVVATGTTVLYQRGLQQRTSQFESTSTNLSQCMNQVTNYKSVLEERESELNATSQDIAKYDTLYGQKVSEVNDLTDELSTTRSALNSMTLQKEQFKNLYSSSLLNISSLENDIGILEGQIDDLKTEKANLAALLADCQSQ